MKKHPCNCSHESSEQCCLHRQGKYRNPWKQEEEQHLLNDDSEDE